VLNIDDELDRCRNMAPGNAQHFDYDGAWYLPKHGITTERVGAIALFEEREDADFFLSARAHYADLLRRMKALIALLPAEDMTPGIKEKYIGWVEPAIWLGDAARILAALDLSKPFEAEA
jgi:hypothetical protein